MKKIEKSYTRHILLNSEIIDEVEKKIDNKEDLSKLKFFKFGKDISLLFTVPLGFLLYTYKKRTTDLGSNFLFLKYVLLFTYFGGIINIYFNLLLSKHTEKIIFSKLRPNKDLIKFFFRIENMKKFKHSSRFIYYYIDNVISKCPI